MHVNTAAHLNSKHKVKNQREDSKMNKTKESYKRFVPVSNNQQSKPDKLCRS